MALNASISIVVPPLTDQAVWFANAAAWSNYWQNINLEATFDPAATVKYVAQPYDAAAHVAPTLTIDGQDFVLCSKAMFDALLNQLNVLDLAFQQMRTDLKDAGFIDNAQ